MSQTPLSQQLSAIILKSAYTSLTAEEQAILDQFLAASEANRIKYKELTEAASLEQKLAQYGRRDANKDEHFQYILQHIQQQRPVPGIRSIFRRYSWAAVLIGLSAMGAIWYALRSVPTEVADIPPAPVPATVISAGKPGAQLTLADGSVVVLDSMGNGMVTQAREAKVMLHNGQLKYTPEGEAAGTLVYNTLSTPKGREFKVMLPDGTLVWLNSASSIRYPMAFAASERVVYVSGEAYFEVAPVMANGHKTPFRVHVSTPQGDAGIVEVLGTHFNINAYSAIARTTLLEGKVKVKADTQSVQASTAVLQPGQQAQVAVQNHHLTTATANIDQVMAWRRGFFNFDNATIEEVMNQLARWYDVEVEYTAGVPPIAFEGELNRQMDLQSVLNALKDTKVHFKIAGRKIIILP